MRQYLFTHNRKRRYALLVGDALIIAFSILLSYGIRLYIIQKNPTLAAIFAKLDPRHTLVILVHLFSLYLLNQYNLNRMLNPIRSTVILIISVLLSGLIISGVLFFFPKYIFGRQV